MNKIKITISLIHNNNLNRNEYIIPQLTTLKDSLTDEFGEVQFIKSQYQAAEKKVSLFLVLIRKITLFILYNKWNNYLELNLIQKLKNCLYNIIFTLKLNDYNVKIIPIQLYLTDKHIRSWASFLESDSDILISFEDDAIFDDNSIERLIQYIKQYAHCNLLYADLAGAFTPEELKTEKLLKENDSTDYFYIKPVTNTTCSYLCSRSLIDKFYNKVNINPILRLINIDWLINKNFTDIYMDKIECTCIHANPTIFKHGSIRGYYKSTMV